MTSAGPSHLSIAAGALYCAVAALCWVARMRAIKRHQTGADGWKWTACCGLFILLAISRWLDLEHGAHDAVRTMLERGGLYGGRYALQAPLAVLAVLGATLVGYRWMGRWKMVRAQPPGKYLLIAQIAAFGMIALVSLRAISWHYTDVLLYGWRLNWVLDPLCALVVVWAALKYRAAAGPGTNHPQ